jgi:hypothetical protein
MLPVDIGDMSVEMGFRGSALGFREGEGARAAHEEKMNSVLDAISAGLPPARAQREGGLGGEFRDLLRPRCLTADGDGGSLPSRPLLRLRPDLFRPAMARAAEETPAVKDRGGRNKSGRDGGCWDNRDPLAAISAQGPPARAPREGRSGGRAIALQESLPSRPTFRPRPDLFRPAMALAAGEAPAVKDRGGRNKSARDGGCWDKGDPLERLGRPALLLAGGDAPCPCQSDSRRRSPPSPPSRCARTGGTPAALGLWAVFFTGAQNRKFESQTRKKPACLAESPAGFALSCHPGRAKGAIRDLVRRASWGPGSALRAVRDDTGVALRAVRDDGAGQECRAGDFGRRRSCVNLPRRGGAPIHRSTDEAARRRPGAAAQRNRGHRRKRQPAIAIAPRKMRRGPPTCRNIHP